MTYLDLNQIDWLQEAGLGRQHAGVQDTPCSGDDLPTSSVNGVCVECHIMDVKPDTSQVFFTQRTLNKGVHTCDDPLPHKM